eukprot:11316941-Ditylum_brightwellii.AAC.1
MVELSVIASVGSWGWPISSRTKQSSSPLQVLRNKAPISASVAEAMTVHNILHTVWTGPLSGTGAVGGLFGSSDAELRKKWPPAQLHSSVSDKYKISLWMRSIILLAKQFKTSSGC